jgi:hypothetical protein
MESDDQVTLMSALHANKDNTALIRTNLSNNLSGDTTELSVDPTGPKFISNTTIDGDGREGEMTNSKYITVIRRRAKREKCAGIKDNNQRVKAHK